MNSKTVLIDAQVERLVICTLWEETRSFGAKHGRSLLARVQLTAGDFAGEESAHLFRVIEQAISAGRAPALDSTHGPKLGEYLQTSAFLPLEPMDAHAVRLKELSHRRWMLASAQRIYRAALEGEMSTDELNRLYQSEAKGTPTRGVPFRPLSATMKEIQQHLHDVADGKKKSSVLTGFPIIDSYTAGLPSTLVVIAAMPGVGKSAFEAAIIRNMAMRGEKSLTFCMEDRSEWLAFRLLAHESKIHQAALRHRSLDGGQWQKVGDAMQAFNGFGGNILCDDREALTPTQVLATARQAVQQFGVQAIFLDNMTSMQFSHDPDRRGDLQIQDFLRDARGLAAELNVPFTVLAHVKRRPGLDVEQIPNLTDCAESASYERLARVAYGLASVPGREAIAVRILKNTNGVAFATVEISINPKSAMADLEMGEVRPSKSLSVVPNA